MVVKTMLLKLLDHMWMYCIFSNIGTLLGPAQFLSVLIGGAFCGVNCF